MKITKVYEVCFSPTGGTEKALKIFTEALGMDAEMIDISVEAPAREFGPDELVIFGVPSYGGRVPQTAIGHMQNLKGKGTPAVMIVSYGNRDYDDTFLELKNEVEKLGFVGTAAIAAVTEHSIMHQYGTGRPDEADCRKLAEFAGKVKDKLENAEVAASILVPGRQPYREYNGVPLKPSADPKKCTGCGLCASRCPVHAISAEHPEKTDKDVCISCMRCISICPDQARSLNKLMLAAAGQKLKKACQSRKENKIFL